MLLGSCLAEVYRILMDDIARISIYQADSI